MNSEGFTDVEKQWREKD